MAINVEETAKRGVTGMHQMMCGPANGEIPTPEEKVEQYQEALKVQEEQEKQRQKKYSTEEKAGQPGEQQANGPREREDETKKDIARHHNVEKADDKRINTNEALENRKGDLNQNVHEVQDRKDAGSVQQEKKKSATPVQDVRGVRNESMVSGKQDQGQGQASKDNVWNKPK